MTHEHILKLQVKVEELTADVRKLQETNQRLERGFARMRFSRYNDINLRRDLHRIVTKEGF
jgi:hypothetical protein